MLICWLIDWLIWIWYIFKGLFFGESVTQWFARVCECECECVDVHKAIKKSLILDELLEFSFLFENSYFRNEKEWKGQRERKREKDASPKNNTVYILSICTLAFVLHQNWGFHSLSLSKCVRPMIISMNVCVAVAKQPYKYHICVCEKASYCRTTMLTDKNRCFFHRVVCSWSHYIAHSSQASKQTHKHTLIIKIIWIIQVNCLCHTHTHTMSVSVCVFICALLLFPLCWWCVCVCCTYYVSCFNTKCFEPRGDKCRAEISNDERERERKRFEKPSRAEPSQA